MLDQIYQGLAITAIGGAAFGFIASEIRHRLSRHNLAIETGALLDQCRRLANRNRFLAERNAVLQAEKDRRDAPLHAANGSRRVHAEAKKQAAKAKTLADFRNMGRAVERQLTG